MFTYKLAHRLTYLLMHLHRYALHMLTDHDKLDTILEGDERLDLVKLFEKVFVLIFFSVMFNQYWIACLNICCSN